MAISAALRILGVDIQFLDRRYNWLQYGRGNLAMGAQVVVAHACDEGLRKRFCAGDPPCCSAAEAEHTRLFPSDIAGKFFTYDRIGFDARPFELRTDGTVGQGAGEAERFYFVSTYQGVRRLVLGGVHDETCTLIEAGNGIWRGHWSAYERMPVKLELHRAQQLTDLLRARQRGWRAKPLRGAELGVYDGETSALLLRGVSNVELYMVDPWREAAADAAYRRTGDPCAALSQARFDQLLVQAATRTEFAGERRTIVPCRQEQAAAFVPDQLDFVFIDGDHSYAGTASAISNWHPKLAPDGLMSGHDYDHPLFPGVKQAVDEFAERYGVRLHTGPDRTWWYGRN